MTDHRSLIRARGLPGLGVLLLCGAGVGALPSAAQAQINPFALNKGPTLTNEDIAAGRAAAGKLLTDDQAEVGKSEGWSNSSSGNQGSLSVLRVFKHQGMDCRALRSQIDYKSTPAKPRKFTLKVCQLKSGEWKLL